jgi:hypothetical protein
LNKLQSPQAQAAQSDLALQFREHVMTCRSCGSNNKTEYGAEINIHLPKDRDKAAVLVFPGLVVCLDCNFAECIIPATDLRLLGQDGAASTAA